MFNQKSLTIVLLVLSGTIALVACSGETKVIEVTRVVTKKETIIETIVVEATEPPEPHEPRTLVICMGQEPETLYWYGKSSLAAQHIRHAIYDGPIDNRTFDYQPIILEKLPRPVDGDAMIETVMVQTGDLVIDDSGAPVFLEEGLLVRPAGCYSPDCAVAFDGSPLEMEQMIVTFKLMQGILWSDGEPLTALDSVYSFELYMDPDTPHLNRHTGERTAAYEAIDDYTTVWTGLPGYRDATYYTNFWHPLPEHRWGDLTALELVEAQESSRRPLGWGPYIIDEWVAGDHLTLSRNDLYWRANEGLPKFDQVVMRFVSQDSNVNIAALLAGECDIVDQNGRLEDQIALLLELEAAHQVDATFVTSTAWEHADFGIDPVEGYDRPDFFQDVRVRQAIAHCMNRQAVVDTVLFGQSQVIDTYIPPNHPLFNPQVVHYEFDIEKGSALLEEASWVDDDGDPSTPRMAQGIEGIPDGTPLEFSYWTTNAAERVAASQVLQASMAACGIKTNLEYWNATDYLAIGPDGPIFGRRFDLGQFTSETGVEPPCQSYLSSHIPSLENGWSGQNVSGFVNADFDLACNAALHALPGTPEYEQHHLEAQRIFAEQVPVIPLYLRLKVAATRANMKGFIMDPTENSELWNIEEFDYGD